MTRRLAAILAADVIGYSKLMSEDQDGTLAALRRLRSEVFAPAVASKRGKIIKSMGDGWLVAFDSAEDAVTCAMHVQDRLTTDPAVKLRIGVHTGDVVHQDEDVFGDGVNIAARLEEISPHGGVAISDAVWGALDGTLKPSFDDQGEKTLKNIAHPVRVWARGGDVAGAAYGGKPPVGFPRLSIIPIETSSDDDEIQELAAAITSDLEAFLGTSQWIDANISTTPVANSYVATGALRNRGDRLRLEISLTASNGERLWGEKYDGLLSDSFDWQDETSQTVATYIFGQLLDREELAIENTPEDQRTAEQWYLYGVMRSSQDPHGLLHAIRCIEKAIEKAPAWGRPYILGLAVLFTATSMGFGAQFQAYLAKQSEWLEKANAAEPKASPARAILAFSEYVRTGDLNAARATMTSILRRLPFDPEVLMFGGYLFLYAGEPKPGLDCMLKLAKQSMHTPYAAAIHNGISFASLQLEECEKSVAAAMTALKINPNYTAARRHMASALAHLGRLDEAKAELDVLSKVIPDNSISKIRSRLNLGDTDGARFYLEGLRLAGMPE